MKNNTLLIFIFCVSVCNLQAQEKTNPIIYLDGNAGYAAGSSHGFMSGGSVNYQKKDKLFTIRATQLINTNLSIISPFLPLPYFDTRETIMEYGFLVGKRCIHDNKAWSFSVGIATLERKIKNMDQNNEDYFDTTNRIGFPFQVDINWFNSKKERYKLYGLIPITKNTSLGNSIGFKLIGNISKTSFIGLGLSFGIGYHKEY